MAKQQEHSYNDEMSVPVKGLFTDTNPINQPKNTYRFALNAVNAAEKDEEGALSNEPSNYECTELPEGFSIVGDVYLGDNESAIILVNPETGKEQIGIVDAKDIYTPHVITGVLGLKITNQCDIRFRIRRGGEKVIYWVDGNKKPRTFNFSRPYNFYNKAFQDYLRLGGDPNTYPNEKWDASSFDLIKSYSRIPFFSNVEIIESGSIPPGSYNFAIQYVDEDLNPTEWITSTRTVNIFNDSVSNPFGRIRGSRNIDSTAQSFPRANKSIRLTITNLDTSFPYYRIAIIQGTGLSGQAVRAIASEVKTTMESTFLYTGNDENLTEVNLGDILIEKEVILSPNHIEQLENRLILADTKGKSINWCEFQKYASKIASDLCTKEVILNSALSEPNIKNPKSTFIYTGGMPGEVEAYGIHYIFIDGYISPVFHIPGKSPSDTESKMLVYETEGKYLENNSCGTGNFWGTDSLGESLLGKKVRHHRYPFRKDVNKPLVTRSTGTVSITKYKLYLTIALNPAWVDTDSSPNFFPKDNEGNEIVIEGRFDYKESSSPTPETFSSQISSSDMGIPILVYQGTNSLDQLDAPLYHELDITSQLASYQEPGGDNYYLVPRFIITETYIPEVVTNTETQDKSEIFGIEFSNIEKPHPDVIGFYIVKCERKDEDKLIVDTAIMGPTIENNQYVSFGLINPKQYGNNKLNYNNNTAWFFSPESQYYGSKAEFDFIQLEGAYSEKEVMLPTTLNTNKPKGTLETYTQAEYDALPALIKANRGAPAYGVYVNDVQAGTSYNPEVHKKKDKDDDGFDLLVGYRNIDTNYTSGSVITFPEKDRIFYLNAASYQNYSDKIYYNVSVDNKIGMIVFKTAFPANLFYNPTSKKSTLLYGALVKNNVSAYSDFMTRPYYRTHNNPVLFGDQNTINNFELYAGDAFISSTNFVSSVFYDMVVAKRKKKSGLWKIFLGAILIVAAFVVPPLAGASVAVASSLLALGISYGVSLAISGIKFEQFKAMIDTDYEKGLKDTVVDDSVHSTIRENLCTGDDTIRWFSDRISNVYMESCVPFGLRSGLTSGVSDFIDSPKAYDEEEFRNYLIEKLTVLDREQGSGRLYKGYAGAEVYDMNKDYTRQNREKVFFHLPVEYDCCSDSNEHYPSRVWYSEQSFQEEKVDNYRVFLPNSYRDIEGEHGAITNLYRLGNSLYIHTREALWHLPQSLQERVTDEIVTFIGTGNFFSLPPKKVVDGRLGGGGSQHKWSTVKTRFGVFFINEIENKIYLHSSKIEELTKKGMRLWGENYITPFLSKQLLDNFNVEYPHTNNPANPFGIGYLATYDVAYERAIFTKRDYLIRKEKIKNLTLISVVPTMDNGVFYYCLEDGYFYIGNNKVSFDNSEYFENKSWTISYSMKTQSWVSFHSYLPNYYLHNPTGFFSFMSGIKKLWKHNLYYNYQNFYGIRKPFIVDYIAAVSPIDKIFEDLTLNTTAKRFDELLEQDVEERYITFNKIVVYNSRQCTGEQEIIAKDSNDSGDWYQEQIVNTLGQVLASRKQRDWTLNDFRDYIIDYTKPMFTSAWEQTQSNYYIDKVVNTAVVDFNKDWHELESFKDKYVGIRLKFDSFDNIKLVLNFSIETEQISFR